MIAHASRSIQTLASSFPVGLALLLAAACPRVATAWDDGPAKPAPRVPGFDIPPAPRDPAFPLLPGAIAPLDTVPHEAGSADAVPSADQRASAPAAQRSPSLPALETWDRSVEAVTTTSRAAAQPPAPDATAAWILGIGLVVALGTVGAIWAAVNLKRPQAAPPVPVVRFGPGGRHGS